MKCNEARDVHKLIRYFSVRLKQQDLGSKNRGETEPLPFIVRIQVKNALSYDFLVYCYMQCIMPTIHMCIHACTVHIQCIYTCT